MSESNLAASKKATSPLDNISLKKESDGAISYTSVAALLTVNNLVYNTLFIILGAMVTQRDYDEQQIGILGSVFLFGQLMANLSGAAWVEKVNWRYAIALSTIACALFMASGAIVDYYPLILVYFLAGSMTGIALSCVFCHMSGMKNPVRAYSIGLISQCLIAGGLIIFLQSLVLPKFGFAGLSYTIAGTIILALIAVPFIPVGPKHPQDNKPHSAPTAHSSEPKATKKTQFSIWPILGLIAIAIYFLGQTSIWAFMERIGNDKGLGADFIATTGAAVLILCAVGAWAADWTGKRWGTLTPIVIGISLFVFSMLLFIFSSSKISYFVAFLLYASAWNYVLPYQMLMVSQGDKNSVYASVIPAFQSIGAAAGPATVGFLVVATSSYVPAYLMAIGTATTSLALFALIRFKKT